MRVVTGTGAQSVGITDDLIAWAPGTPAAATFTLPSSPRVGEQHGFKYLAASGSFAMTVAAPSGQTIDGAATQSIGTLYAVLNVVYIGSNEWIVISVTVRFADMLHPHFSPDITLGHLVQAAVVLIAGGGGILGGYLSLRQRSPMPGRAEYRVALAAHEARLTEAERELDDRRREDREFQTEMRAALERVMQTLADLRTELVQKQNRR